MEPVGVRPSPADPAAFPAAAATAGRIYVMGGYGTSAGFLARVERL